MGPTWTTVINRHAGGSRGHPGIYMFQKSPLEILMSGQRWAPPTDPPPAPPHRPLAFLLSRIPTAVTSPIVGQGAWWDSLKTGSFRLPLPNRISSRSTQASSRKPSSNHSAHPQWTFLHPLNSGPAGTGREARPQLESGLPTTAGAFETGSPRPPDPMALCPNPGVLTAISCAKVQADLGLHVRPAPPMAWHRAQGPGLVLDSLKNPGKAC